MVAWRFAPPQFPCTTPPERERYVKKTFQAFPVAKLPQELRRGLQSVEVVGITIETPDTLPEEDDDPIDLGAPEAVAEQGRRIEAHCARRKSW